MKESKQKLIRLSPLFFILLVALMLRVQQWNVFLGADETRLMDWVRQLHNNPFPIHHYPPFFLYLNYILSFIYKEILLFLGVIHFDASFVNADFGYIFTLKAGRILGALCGTLQVYLVYLIGKRFYNRHVGLSSALLLAVCPPLVIEAHTFKSDVLLALLLTLMLFFVLKFTQNPEPKYILYASFFLGLSTATKYNGIFMVLLLVFAFVSIKGKLNFRIFRKSLFFLFIGGVCGFFIGAPNWVVHPAANVKNAFGYLKGLSEELIWYDKLPSSYILYAKNILESFGIVLTVLLLAGLVLSFVKKKPAKVDIVVSAYVLLYFLLIGQAGYLNHRGLLPVFVGASLIIGKLLFHDLKRFFRDRPKILKLTLPLAWIIILVFFINRFTVNQKSFNLLHTISSHPVRMIEGLGQPDYSYYYMKNHIPTQYSIFREMYTPPVTGYHKSGFWWDVTRPPMKRFKGEGAFDFLITSRLSDYILTESKNKKIRQSAVERVRNYMPFYSVYRPRVFLWNDDITFWYKKPGFIKTRAKINETLPFPRLIFYDEENPTIYLPLQRYEKNPNAGKITNGKFLKRFFSTQKIKELTFHILTQNTKYPLYININNISKQIFLNREQKINQISLSGIKPEIFSGIAIRHFQEVSIDQEAKNTTIYLYKLEITTGDKRMNCPVVFIPAFINEKPEKLLKPILSEKLKEDIAPLFSREKYPIWFRKFYKKTGIDLSLLTFINTQTIYKNPSLSTTNIETSIFPLEKGHYIITITGSKIMENLPLSQNIQGKLLLQSNINPIETRTFLLTEKDTSSPFRIPFQTKNQITFARLTITGLSRNSYIIQEVTLQADYKAHINQYFAPQ
jgi:4-amino-4-deoxy-L-arabinose transferase-like glycosyltransferase